MKADWSEDLNIDAPSAAALERAGSLLRKIARPSSVYPAIAPDGDGGIEIRWRAELQSLRIEIDPDGHVSAAATDPLGKPIFELDDVSDYDIPMLGASLWSLSDYVESHNPDWRRWFRHP